MRSRNARHLTVLALALCAAAHGGEVTLRLSAAARTSAGIFDADGRLVRTLWSARSLPAGAVQVTWDGRDDAGNAVATNGVYRVRMLAHEVRYVWEGVIGNTSAEMSGSHVHRSLLPIVDMAIDRTGNAFYAVGYNEQQSGMHRFRVTDPQRPSSIGHADFRREFWYVATDGELVYFANRGHRLREGATRDRTFVVALQVKDGTEYRFTDGSLEAPVNSGGGRWQSVIDAEPADPHDDGYSKGAASGLAVQTRGSTLFVAHAARNVIRAFDKRSGRLLGTVNVREPEGLAIGPDESLWVISSGKPGARILHFEGSGGQWHSVEPEISALRDPVALGVSPVDGTVVVADAATDQLHAFGPTGKVLWVLGRLGGFRDPDPRVSSDRFWFSGSPAYVAFQADGSFWFGDPGNLRNLHFSRTRDYIEQIAYLPAVYVATADVAAPSRVFCGFLEFEVDNRRPIAQSWTLVRNWGAGLGREQAPGWLDAEARMFMGFRSVVTLADGHTLGVARRLGTEISDVFDLSVDRGARRVGKLDLGDRLYPDGSQRGQVQRQRRLSVYRRDYKGFDTSGAAHWSEPRLIAAVPELNSDDPYYHDVPTVVGANDAVFPDIAGGLVASFAPGLSNGYHLGALRPGTDGWVWRASPSGAWSLDRNGNVELPDGRYESERGASYPGSIAVTSGRHIIYGYHGEGWNGGQANQWLHFDADGLFIGQFGVPDYPRNNEVNALPAAAGNSFSPQLVAVDSHLYLWHNDESVHSGLHRWRIDGVETLQRLEARIAP